MEDALMNAEMMRAQLTSSGDRLILHVCGRLAEESVLELENCWTSARTDHPGGKLLVDLKHVTFIDDKGRSLLERMHRDGATFAAAGLLTRSIVDNITRNEA
jgi:anti-anti-sigma regulatory factor